MHPRFLNPVLWPVERPNDQPLGEDTDRAIAEGILYVEDAGHGWRRIGLSPLGRAAARAVADATAAERERQEIVQFLNLHDCAVLNDKDGDMIVILPDRLLNKSVGRLV